MDARAAHLATSPGRSGICRVGYKEVKSAGSAEIRVEASGLRIENNVAGIHYRLHSQFGGGKPVLAVLGNMTPCRDSRRSRFRIESRR